MSGSNSGSGDVDPPLAPIITGFSTDTGASATDGITKDDRLIFTGTAEALSTVELFVDGTSIGTTSADAAGAWSFDHSGTGLMQGAVGIGQFRITAQACDAAGNLSEPSVELLVEVDNQAPQKPIITGVSDDNGYEDDDFLTNDQNLVIHGEGEPGSTMTVWLNGVLAGTALVGNDAQWSVDATAMTLVTGTHVISARAEDVAGNLSAPADDVVVTIDTYGPTAPTITSITPDTGASDSDALTNAIHLIVSGTGPADERIVLTATLAGVPVFPEPFAALVAPDGSWTIDLTGFDLPEGDIRFSAVSEDLAGNQSSADTADITIDITPGTAPVIQAISTDTGRSASDGVTLDTTLALSGTADAGSPVEVLGTHASSGGFVMLTATADGQGNWTTSPTAPLAEGEWIFTAVAFDPAGNPAGGAPYTVEIDTLAATPSITGISDDSGASGSDGITYDTTLEFRGTSEPWADVELFLNGVSAGTGYADQFGDWTVSLVSTPLAFGSYTATAKITDLAGSVSALSAPFSVTIEDITANPPAITSISLDTGASATDGITRDNRLEIHGTSAPTAQVDVFAGTLLLGTATADRSGNWTLDAQNSALVDGAYVLTAEILGPGATRSAPSQPFALTVDTTIQTPTIDWMNDDTGASASDLVTQDATPVFGGTAEPNATIVLEYEPSTGGWTAFGTVTADGAGDWSSAGAAWYGQVANNSLPDGTYNFRATVTDLAGNTGTGHLSGVVVDTTPPAVTPAITAIENDSGTSVVGTLTNDASLDFEGTGGAGDLVELIAFGALGTVSLGTASVNASGNWTIANAPALAEGDWSFKAQVVDLAGNSAVSATVSPVSIDVTPPVKPVITSWYTDRGYYDDDNLTANKSVSFVGTGDMTSLLEVWMKPVGGTAVLFGGVTPQPGNSVYWERQWGDGVSPPEGVVDFYVTSRDAAGNSSTSDILQIEFDFTPPTNAVLTGMSDDTGTSATDWITKDTTLTFSGTGFVLEELMLGVYPGSDPTGNTAPLTPIGKGTVHVDGTWDITTDQPMADGTYALVIADIAGNRVPTNQLFTVDTVVSRLSFDAVHDASGTFLQTGVLTNSSGLTFLGYGEVGAAISLTFDDGQGSTHTLTGTANSGEVWTISDVGTPIPDGSYSVSVVAVDIAGNRKELTSVFDIDVDRTPPLLDFGLSNTVFQNGILAGVTETANNEQAFAIDVEAGASVTFQLPNGISFKDITKNGTGRVFAPTTPFTTSFTDTFTAIAEDAAGNVTTKSVTYSYNAPPDDIALATDEIGEHAAPGTLVGQVLVTEAGAPSDLASLSLINAGGTSLFALQQGTSGGYGLVLAAGQTLDFETAASHEVQITATDVFGSVYSETLTIKVKDQLETVAGSGLGETLAGSPLGEEIDAGLGDDVVQGGGGGDKVTLGGGKDTFTGAPSHYNGNRFTDFTGEDQLEFVSATLPRGRFTFGPDGTMQLDQDGDGSPDISFQLDGDFSGGDFMAVVDNGKTIVTFEPFLPVLGDGQAVDGGKVNGVTNQAFLTGNGQSDFQVTLQDMGYAAFNNVLGVYEIDAGGHILDPRILFANTNADKTAQALITDVKAGHRLGFFLVQDAAAWAAGLDAQDVLAFLDDGGQGAGLEDGADIELSVNGTGILAPVFHSFAATMNPDGLERALSGVMPGGEGILIGFEDMTLGGDFDYEDVVFQVEMINPVI